MKWFNNLKIRTKLLSSFFIISLISIIIGYMGYNSLEQMYTAEQEIGEVRLPSVEGLLILSEAQTNVDSAENALLTDELAGTDRQAQYDRITASLKKAEEGWNIYEPLPQTTEEKQTWDEFVPAWNKWKQDDADYIGMMKQFDTAKTPELKDKLVQQALVTNSLSFGTSKSMLQKLVDINMKVAENARRNAGIVFTNAFKLLLLTIIVGLLSAIIIGLYLSRIISSPVKRAMLVAEKIAEGDLTIEVKAAETRDEIGQLFKAFVSMLSNLREIIMKINQASQSLASSSQQLAASSEEASSTSIEIAGTVSRLAEGTASQTGEMQNISNNIVSTGENIGTMSTNASDVTQSSHKVLNISNEGLAVAEKAVSKIQAIQEISAEATRTVNLLGEESQKIGQIVDVIKAISEQTNLLALNAAIEAARAGEHGKGFAVVAEEVRKLAEQSTSSAHQITELVNNIRSKTEKAVRSMADGTREVEEGVVIIDAAGNSFRIIVNEINGVVTQIDRMNSSIRLVANNSTEIAKSIDNAVAISQQAMASTQEASASSEEQTAAMEEVASAAQDLAGMAEELHAIISRFKY